MQGRRVYLGDGETHLKLAPGDYGKDERGVWKARPPQIIVEGLEKQQHPLSGELSQHEVVEHEDGTITVSPSILIHYPWGGLPHEINWHGYLERGVWRQC